MGQIRFWPMLKNKEAPSDISKMAALEANAHKLSACSSLITRAQENFIIQTEQINSLKMWQSSNT
jgi:hypothetical protein